MAATLTNTMGRQKLGSSPRQPSRRVKGVSERGGRRVERGRGRERERSKEKTLLAGQRTCIICREEARLFHADCFTSGDAHGGEEGNGEGRTGITLVSIGRRIVWMSKMRSKAFVLFTRTDFCTHAGNTLLAMKRWNERPLLLAPSKYRRDFFEFFHARFIASARSCTLNRYSAPRVCRRRDARFTPLTGGCLSSSLGER